MIAGEVRAGDRGSPALISLLTADGSRQFVRATYGAGMEDYVGLELPMEGNLTSLVIKTGKPHFSREPDQDPRLNQDLVRSGQWRDVIEAPIGRRTAPWGCWWWPAGSPAGLMSSTCGC